MARQALHDILCEIIGDKKRCYFEPPDGKNMSYPCFVYNHTNDQDVFADNIHYNGSKRYTVTYITEDPDDKTSEKLKESLSYCTSDRNFDSEGLKHFVYTLFYSGPRIKEEKENEN